MAQPDDSGDQNTCFNGDTLGRAQIYFERAKSLDSDNLVAKTFLEQVPVMMQGVNWQSPKVVDSDEEDMSTQRLPGQAKRYRMHSI